MPKVNTAESFWGRVDKRGPDECWPWLGPVTSKNYGKLSWENKDRRAHQLAFMLTRGYLPPATLHSCDNPPCCNPKHLFAGTNGLNNSDRMQKGRNGYVLNENHYACRFSNEEILKMRDLNGKMTQREIASLFGTSQGYVSQILNDPRRRRGI